MAGEDRARAAVRLGVAGAALAFAVVGMLHALSVPPYVPADEPTHIGYVLVLREGRLPTIDTPIPRGWSEELDAVVDRNVAGLGAYRGDVLVANHPPLFYALAALPVALGERAGGPEHGLRLGRLLSVLLASGGVVATGVLASALAPGRPRVTITAAWFSGLLPLNAHVASYLYTDGLAVAAFIGALAASAVLVRRGWSGSRVALVALLGGVAAASRASGMAATGAAGVAVLVAGWRAGGPTAARLSRALGGAGAVLLLFAVLAGWFYARNLMLYEDPTGAAALVNKIGRETPEPFLAPMRSATTWRLWLQDYWDGFAGGVKPFHETGWRPAPWVLGALILAGGAPSFVRWLRRPRLPSDTMWTWAAPLAACAVLWVSILQFIAIGGGLHPRYALGTAAVAATVVGLCLEGYPGRRKGLPTLALVAAMLVLNAAALMRYLALLPGWPQLAAGDAGALPEALGGSGLAPVPVLGVAGGLLAVAVGLLWRSLRLAGSRAAAADDALA